MQSQRLGGTVWRKQRNTSPYQQGRRGRAGRPLSTT